MMVTTGNSSRFSLIESISKTMNRLPSRSMFSVELSRKYYGEAIVVTQEVDDIISSPVVKESIINNSDCKILLDQRKYMNKFDQIQALLGLTEKEKSQILSINMANNPSRLYKEVWIGLGGTQSAVYATEVSAEEYLAYTTEETEKVEVYRLAEKLGDDIEAAIRQLAERRRNKE
jgi:conjugation system TraG family ATPase